MADLDRIRDDLAAFAAEVGHPLAPWQAGALSLQSIVTAIVAPRQSGKSRSLALLAVWWAFRRPEHRVLIVSAGEEASRRLLGEVRRIATGSPLLAGSVLDEQAQLVTLSNGAEVRSVPASERQVRGWTVDLLLIDEAAMVANDLLLGAAFPTTAARPDARIVMASSATSADGAFYDHAMRGQAGDEHVRTFRWRLDECEWISASMIAAARDSMTETRFAAEYEGVFASGADALFSRAVLDRVTYDYLPAPLAELRGPARVAAGVDWGATNDRSALVAIARLRGGPFAVVTAERWPAGEPLHRVVNAIASSPAHFDTLAMETNGLGLPLAQDLTRAIRERSPLAGGGTRPGPLVLTPQELDDYATGRTKWLPGVPPAQSFVTQKLQVHVTAEVKALMYSTLRLLVDREQLVLPASAEELLRELLLLRVDLSPSGAERIEASSGHDDLADALALALAPYRSKRDGKWRCYLAQLAEAMPPGAGELDVPRRPILFSIRTGERTVPPGVDPDPKPPPRHSRLIESTRAAVREALAQANDEEVSE